MSLLRWQPWQEIDTIRRQLDQAFDELTHDSVFKSVNTVARVPAIELSSTEDNLLLKAELPGISGKDLEVEVTREAVSLKGEYRQETRNEHQQVHRTELRYGSFHRMIPLPVEVNNTEATAAFKDGVLTLTLPKIKETKPEAFKVTIDASEAKPSLKNSTTDAKPIAEVENAPTNATVETPDTIIDDAWQ